MALDISKRKDILPQYMKAEVDKTNKHFNNEHEKDYYVFSDDQFDYHMVNAPDGNHSLTKYFGDKGGEYESYPLNYLTDGLIPTEEEWQRTLLIRWYNLTQDQIVIKYLIYHRYFIVFDSGKSEKEFKIDMAFITIFIYMMELSTHGLDFGGALRVVNKNDTCIIEKFRELNSDFMEFRHNIGAKLTPTFSKSVEHRNSIACKVVNDYMDNEMNKVCLEYLCIDLLKLRFKAGRGNIQKEFLFLSKKWNLNTIERLIQTRMPKMNEEQEAKKLYKKLIKVLK